MLVALQTGTDNAQSVVSASVTMVGGIGKCCRMSDDRVMATRTKRHTRLQCITMMNRACQRRCGENHANLEALDVRQLVGPTQTQAHVTHSRCVLGLLFRLCSEAQLLHACLCLFVPVGPEYPSCFFSLPSFHISVTILANGFSSICLLDLAKYLTSFAHSIVYQPGNHKQVPKANRLSKQAAVARLDQ